MSEHLISHADARENLLACATFLAETIKTADGHAEAMKTLVPIYLDRSDVDTAAEFANAVDDPFTRDKLLMLTAEKCAAIDDDDYALQLAEAIDDEGLQLQAVERIAAQKSLKGEYDKAFTIADRLHHPEYAHAEIAVRRAAAGDETRAAEIIENIEFAGAKVSAYQSIAANLIAADQKEKAVELLDKAVYEALSIEHSEEKIRALNEIGSLFIEADRRDRAVETFDKAKTNAERLDNVYRDFLLANAALGFFRAGSVELADRALDEVNDKTQIASALIGFSREQQLRGESADALATLEEAHAVLKSQHERETRDSKSKFALFTTIAAQFAGYGKSERAIEIAQLNQDETEQAAGLTQIAQIAATREDDGAARQAINAIAEDADRLTALIGVSDAAERAGRRGDAVKFLGEAAQLAETVPQLSVRSTAFNDLAMRFFRYGETETARRLTHQNLEIIQQIRDESIRVVALAQLSEIYTEAEFTLTDAEKEILSLMIRRAEM